MMKRHERVLAIPSARVLSALRWLLFYLGPIAAPADQYLDFTYVPTSVAVEISKYTGTDTSVIVPSRIQRLPVTSIGGWAFAGRTSLMEVSLPYGVSYIAVFAFSGCSGLGQMVLPERLTTISSFAFDHCTGLTNLVLPDSLITIGDQAFSYCGKLTSITFPPRLTSIGDQAFSHCGGLTNLIIPSGVTHLGISAFAGCERLAIVRLPETLTRIGDFAFSGCPRLTMILLNTPNPAFSSLGGVLFNQRQNVLIAYPPGKTGAYTLPRSVTRVQNYAFSDCTNLTTVTLPGGVTRLGSGAFSGCRNLTAVYFEGNAPQVDGSTLFLGAKQATVYFRAGATGWGKTFMGRPTQVWPAEPAYADWAKASGLASRYPNASGETDDPDQDGATNLAEMYAGTDPTESGSVLRFETEPRPQDLEDIDRTRVYDSQLVWYFRSVPGKTYTLLSAKMLGGTWQEELTVTASTTQKRLVLDKTTVRRYFRLAVHP